MSRLDESKSLVIEARAARMKETQALLSAEEKDALIRRYHPDFRKEAYRPIRLGPNQGEQTVHELANLLEGESPVAAEAISLSPQHQVDLLIIGGGGAGATAALTAKAAGAKVLLAT